MTQKTQTKDQHILWNTPWGYAESFIIGFGILIIGFLLEVVTTSSHNTKLVFPYNLYFLLGYVALLIASYAIFKKSNLIKWFTKVPASITSLSLVTFLVMIMGLIPQNTSNSNFVNNLGLNQMTSNWAFILMLLFLLSCLGFVTLKRISILKWDNMGFLLNHFGLFLMLSAGFAGADDIQRLSIRVDEGEAQFIATDYDNNRVELPFAFYLNDFSIEEYNPKLALVDNKTGKIVHGNGKNLFLIESNKSYSFETLQVKIDSFFKASARFGERYVPVNEQGSAPAALLSVKHLDSDSIVKGWISSGSYRAQYESLKINEYFSIVMTIPEVKKFKSDVDILSKDGSRINAIIEVNKPFKYKGWNIYQLSYNEKMGKWSTTSVLELVRDPWLPIVYIGVFMLIFGSFFMLWKGNNKIKTENNDLD